MTNILSKPNRLIHRTVELLHNVSNFFLYSPPRIYSFRARAIFHGKNAMYCCIAVCICRSSCYLWSVMSLLTVELWVLHLQGKKFLRIFVQVYTSYETNFIKKESQISIHNSLQNSYSHSEISAALQTKMSTAECCKARCSGMGSLVLKWLMFRRIVCLLQST